MIRLAGGTTYAGAQLLRRCRERKPFDRAQDKQATALPKRSAATHSAGVWRPGRNFELMRRVLRVGK